MKQGVRAVLMTSASCPPLLGVNNSIRTYGAACPGDNLKAKDYLLSNPEIKTVVLSAAWRSYFREDGPLTAQAGSPRAGGANAASNALGATLQWLLDENRQVVLIGDVPVYNKSVPLALVLEQAGLHKFVRSSLFSEQQKNASFTEAVEASKRKGASFSFLDPLKWMCAEECVVIKSGVPMYFDLNHFSVAGAMSLEDPLSQGLFTVLAEPRDLRLTSSPPAR